MLQGSQGPPSTRMCDPGGESQRPPQGATTERSPRRGMATHREGMHIGPNGGWVIVFLRQTYSSSMTPANNCPPLYVCTERGK